MMNEALWQKAAAFHGHECPGLAIGVRAASEAIALLKVDNIQSWDLLCVVENAACYVDGIQAVFGSTLGKGNLFYRPTGKSAFSFFRTDTGESVRFLLKDMDGEMSREERIGHILNAPLEEVFSVGKPRFSPPEKAGHHPALACSVCGEKTEEDKLRIKDGKPVCLECAGIL